MIRTATHVGAWINDDDPTLGAETDITTVLSDVREIGFEGIELGHDAAFADAARQAGVPVIGARHGLNLLQSHMPEEQARLAPVLERLQAAGASLLSVHEMTESIHTNPRAPLSERPELPGHLWASFGAALDEITSFADGYGMKLMYHPQLGTMVQTPAEIAALIDATGPATGLLFDSAQIAYAGGEPLELFRRHAARIGHIHLGNVRPRVMDFGRANDWPYIAALRAGVFTVPGDPDGGLELDAILRAAMAGGYDGWVVTTAPQDPALYTPLSYQTMALRHLERMLGRGSGGAA
ncbi:TIM barrel protein [Oceanibium sediminis]|uniref:TIM barrel protein n=1 Tax=Oceanibium sediminis TaxID=2026339 RepID=UPI000DD2CF1F|nr:TIM barrel protein [Oceanibium sediminis]